MTGRRAGQRQRHHLTVSIKHGLFYQVLGETTGLQIGDEADLMSCMMELADIKKKYDKITQRSG